MSAPVSLNCYQAQIVVDLGQFLLPDLIHIVRQYLPVERLSEFGSKDWKRVNGYHVESFKLGPEYDEWLSELDEIDLKEHEANPEHPVRLNSQISYYPILIPPRFDFSTLEQLVQKPFRFKYLAGKPNLKSEKPYWAVARKELVGKGQFIESLTRDFGELPSVLSVATVAQVLRAQDCNNDYLNETTFTFAKEIHTHFFIVGGKGDLHINAYSDPSSSIGLAIVREFPAYPL